MAPAWYPKGASRRVRGKTAAQTDVAGCAVVVRPG